MKKIINAVILFLCVGISNAATVTMIPSATDVVVNDTFSVDLVATGIPENGGSTLGVRYDQSILNLDSVSLMPGSPFDFVGLTTTDPRYDVVNIFAPLTSNAIGDFNIVTMNFTAIAAGLSNISMVDDVNTLLGWFDPDTFDSIPDVVYENTAINVSAIPLPAAVWLMLSGMGMLLGIRRRKISL